MRIRPFTIAVPDHVLDRIAARLADARVGYAPAGGGWQWGTDRDYLAAFTEYWRTRYDWRAAERGLNALPQFVAEIEGVDIHFLHMRGEQAGGRIRLPILLTHGWPGSFVEFLDVIPLLTRAGFDVVVPSLPGYGWSGRPQRPLGPASVARIWRTLMTEVLGYPRFFAQGGDWGSTVTCQLGIAHADVVQAVHLNFFMGPPRGSSDDHALTDYWRSVDDMMREESGYQHQQSTRPQTLGLALHDNPVGFASWVLEKFRRWGDTGGDIERRFSKNRLITNMMTYLATDSVISSFWLYYGSAHEARQAGRVEVPTALASYPGEFYPLPPRHLAERAFNVARWSVMPAGGHFAAMEEPDAFARDVITFLEEQS